MIKGVRIAAFFVVIILMIGMLSPFFIGLYIQKNYHSILTFSNSLSDFRVVSLSYKRGWFSSDALVTIEINNDDYFDVLNYIGIQKQDILRRYTIEQHIQHGPWLYQNNLDIPFWFGFATIKNKFRVTPDLKKWFDRLGIDTHLIQNNDEYISLMGHYFYHFKISSIHILFPEMNSFMNIGGFESHVWFDPANYNARGHFAIQSVEVNSQGDSISFPYFKYTFHIYPGIDDLWLGASSFTMSQLVASEKEGLKAILSNVHYYSDADMRDGKFNSSRKIDVEKIQFYNQMIGPFHFQARINKINAEALVNLFASYNSIIKRGELYPGQLESKMLTLLPALVTSGSSIQLDKLDINTPSGKLYISGTLQWDMNDASIPDELSDLVKAANINIHLRASKLLVNDFIKLYITSPLMNDEAFGLDEKEANDLNENINYNIHNNSILIESLVDAGQLRDIDAEALLKLQDDLVPIQDYAEQIRQILWNKYLTRQSSYLLFWGYLGIENAILAIEEKIQENQKNAELDIHDELNALIKEGYLIQNKNEYIMSIQQKNGEMKFNGK